MTLPLILNEQHPYFDMLRIIRYAIGHEKSDE